MSSPAPAPTPAPSPAPTPAPSPSAAASPALPRPAALGPLYRLFLSSISSRGRLISLGLLGVVGIVVGGAVRGQYDHIAVWVRFTSTYGLALMAPVVSLVFASATLGNLAEEGSLVYVWLRPVPRWQLALAAYAAALTIVLPLVVGPLAIGSIAADAGGRALWGTIAANAVGVAAYCGLFTWLGLRVRRPLAWGLAYIMIWEGFVAGASTVASRLALRAYSRSILSRATGVYLRRSNTSLVFAYLVPLVVAALTVWITGRRLARTDVA